MYDNQTNLVYEFETDDYYLGFHPAPSFCCTGQASEYSESE